MAALLHRLSGRLVHRHHVVAVHDHARDAVGFGAVGEVGQARLQVVGGGVGPLVVLQHQHQRRALHGGEVQAFMKNAGGAATVADPGERDFVAAQIARAQPDASHDRNQIAQHRDGRDHALLVQIAEVGGAVLAAGGRARLGGVLHQDVARAVAFDQHRAQVADHGRNPVALFERVGGADRGGFLPQRAIDSAHDLVLAEHDRQQVFQLAVELHPVVQLKMLLPAERQATPPIDPVQQFPSCGRILRQNSRPPPLSPDPSVRSPFVQPSGLS